MTPIPDPQTLREVARRNLTVDAITITPGDIVGIVKAHLGDNADEQTLLAWYHAMREELAGAVFGATVSWPDEPVQDGIDPYHGDMPDDDEFMEILSGASSMYAEVTAFQRFVATIGVEQAYRKWSELLRQAERVEYQEEIDRLIGELAKVQPQDERAGDVRAVSLGAEIATTERITSLLYDLDTLTKERDQARDALAALRGRLRPEWGYGPHSLDVVSTSSAVHAGEVARRRGEKRWTRLKTDWAEVADDA